MKYHVIDARYLRGYTLWLKFRDGTAGEIDLSNELNGPMLAPLRDVGLFKQFSIHPEFRTLVWPNGADIAPELLHDNVKIGSIFSRTSTFCGFVFNARSDS